MQFALNYSPQAAQALNDGTIQIDRFKCPPWDDLTRDAVALKPVYIHFSLVTGGLAKTDWMEIERWLRKTDTPKVNIHLFAREQDLPGITQQPEADARQRVIAQFIDDLETLVGYFGAENVIGENIPFGQRSMEKQALSYCIEPGVIRAVLEATNCGLLLDTAHATITSQSLGIEPMDYINALPLERTEEVHMTGVREHEGVLLDHLAFTDADFATADSALSAVFERGGRPWIATCEYGGITSLFDWRSDYNVIVNDVPRFASMVARFNALVAT